MEDFTFTWKDYQKWTANLVQNIHENAYFTDVTLVSDDLQQIRAHKFVLSASSHIFWTVFNSMPNDSSCLFLKSVKHQELSRIVTFLYKGEVKVPRENIGEFMEAAQDLQIKDLIESDIDTEGALEEYSVPDVTNTDSQKYSPLKIKTEDNELSLVLKCNKCDIEFERNNRNTNRDFKIHMYEVHGSNVKKYNCGPPCNFIALRKEHHVAHERSQNCKLNTNYKACPNCEKRYKTEKQYNDHLSGRRCEKQFICDMCTNGFNTATKLSEHIALNTC